MVPKQLLHQLRIGSRDWTCAWCGAKGSVRREGLHPHTRGGEYAAARRAQACEELGMGRWDWIGYVDVRSDGREVSSAKRARTRLKKLSYVERRGSCKNGCFSFEAHFCTISFSWGQRPLRTSRCAKGRARLSFEVGVISQHGSEENITYPEMVREIIS